MQMINELNWIEWDWSHSQVSDALWVLNVEQIDGQIFFSSKCHTTFRFFHTLAKVCDNGSVVSTVRRCRRPVVYIFESTAKPGLGIPAFHRAVQSTLCNEVRLRPRRDRRLKERHTEKKFHATLFSSVENTSSLSHDACGAGRERECGSGISLHPQRVSAVKEGSCEGRFAIGGAEGAFWWTRGCLVVLPEACGVMLLLQRRQIQIVGLGRLGDGVGGVRCFRSRCPGCGGGVGGKGGACFGPPDKTHLLSK